MTWVGIAYGHQPSTGINSCSFMLMNGNERMDFPESWGWPTLQFWAIRSQNAHGHVTRAILSENLQENAPDQMDPMTATRSLRKPAQSKCTKTCQKSHFMQEFTGKMPQAKEGLVQDHAGFFGRIWAGSPQDLLRMSCTRSSKDLFDDSQTSTRDNFTRISTRSSHKEMCKISAKSPHSQPASQQASSSSSMQQQVSSGSWHEDLVSFSIPLERSWRDLGEIIPKRSSHWDLGYFFYIIYI